MHLWCNFNTHIGNTSKYTAKNGLKWTLLNENQHNVLMYKEKNKRRPTFFSLPSSRIPCSIAKIVQDQTPRKEKKNKSTTITVIQVLILKRPWCNRQSGESSLLRWKPFKIHIPASRNSPFSASFAHFFAAFGLSPAHASSTRAINGAAVGALIW